ncbi:MAG TPA: aldo/keto reductase [Spirochaetota bacterium]
MKYRRFGKLDWDASVLGLGTMRLPANDDKSVNEAEAVRMVRSAIENGINYIDTAYNYHEGASETILGKAFSAGYRDKVKIASKSPIWMLDGPEDFDRILDEQLARLQTDHIDFYLMHGIGVWSWARIKEFSLLKRAEAAKAAGKIRHIGFSFHDRFESFKEIIDGYDKWEFCQIQYNYMDTAYQAGKKGLLYAHEKGIPVVVMEPILGGRLSNPPKKILDVINSHHIKRTPTDWAFQWIWSHPEVAVVLSGMSTLEQLEDNIASADNSAPGLLSSSDHSMIDKAREIFAERTLVPCTRCEYCMPCPSGVNIPGAFEYYNNGKIYDDLNGSRFLYEYNIAEDAQAGKCIGCGTCKGKCPQGIVIPSLMPKVHAVLCKGKPYE